MILLIRVRAENSVTLNLPRRQPGRAKRHVMPGGLWILSWILWLDKRSSCKCVCMCFRIYATQVTQCLPRCYIGNLLTHVADIGRQTWQIHIDSTSMMVFLPGSANTRPKSMLTGHHVYTCSPFFFLSQQYGVAECGSPDCNTDSGYLTMTI